MSNYDLRKMTERAMIMTRQQEEQRRRQAANEDEANEDNATDGSNDDDGEGGDSDNDGTPDQPQEFIPVRSIEYATLHVPDFSGHYGDGNDGPSL